MCRFLVFTFPAKADLAGLQSAVNNPDGLRLRYAALQNEALSEQLPAGTSLARLTHEVCDCDSALGSGTSAPFEVDAAGLARVRRKGWSEARVERWIEQQTLAHRRKQDAYRSRAEAELRSWCRLIDGCLGTGVTPSFGVLVHFYTTSPQDESFAISRLRVPRRELSSQLLLHIEEDTVYEFCA